MPGQFHKVLFLGVGGQTVFQGTVDEAEKYFTGLGLVKPPNVNPADFYMDAIDGTAQDTELKPQDLIDKWKDREGTGPDQTDNGLFVKIIDLDKEEMQKGDGDSE